MIDDVPYEFSQVKTQDSIQFKQYQAKNWGFDGFLPVLPWFSTPMGFWFPRSISPSPLKTSGPGPVSEASEGGADSLGGRGPEWRDLQQRGEDQTLEGWDHAEKWPWLLVSYNYLFLWRFE